MAKPGNKNRKLQKTEEKKISFFCDQRKTGFPRVQKPRFYGFFEEIAEAGCGGTSPEGNSLPATGGFGSQRRTEPS
jgi:hypothetical protein